MSNEIVLVSDSSLKARVAGALETLIDTADALSSFVDVMALDSREDEERATELARHIGRVVADSEKIRKEVVEPFKRALARFDKQFRVPRKQLEALKRQISTRVAEQVEARAKALRETQAKALEAVKKEDFREANEHLRKVQAIPERPPEGVAVRWSWHVTQADLRKVPTDFLILNMPAIRAEIKKQVDNGQEPAIPGMEIVKQAMAAIRRS